MKTIELPAHGYSDNGQPEPPNSMFLCGDSLEAIWNHDFPHGSSWTVCLRKRTPKGRRPYASAIKLDIPANVCHGVRYELSNGRMSDKRLLVHDTDELIRRAKLEGTKFWCWVELDNN